MRKKLFAVIMSAMMMITFMPTMAFATNGPTDFTVTKYQNNFTEAVGYLGDDSTATFVVGTIRTYDESDGTIEVQPDCGAYTWVNSSSMTGYYYDLTNTVCTKVNKKGEKKNAQEIIRSYHVSNDDGNIHAKHGIRSME